MTVLSVNHGMNVSVLRDFCQCGRTILRFSDERRWRHVTRDGSAAQMVVSFFDDHEARPETFERFMRYAWRITARPSFSMLMTAAA